MKKKTSKRNLWLRSILILPLLAILIFSFSTKEEVKIYDSEALEIMTQDGASKAQIKEYNKLAKYYNGLDQSNMRIKKSDVDRLKYLYNLMNEKQRTNVEPFPNFPPPPPPPPPAPEDAPKAPKPTKVVKGVNDTEPNIPPPPPKEPKEPKAPLSPEDAIKQVEKLADEGARLLLFDGGPHFKNGMDISKEKAIKVLKSYNGVTVNVREDNYIYKIVELRLPGC